MATTLQSLRDSLSVASFADFSDTIKDRWINRGLYRVANTRDKDGFPLPFLDGYTSVTVANTGIGALPSDFSKAKTLLTTSNPPKKLGYLQPEDFFAMQSNGVGSAPNNYTIFNNGLLLSPAPGTSTSYNLAYTKTVPALVSGTDQPIVPENYRHLVLLAALVHAYRDTDDTTQAELADKELTEELQNMVVDLGLRSSDRSETVATYGSLAYYCQEFREYGFDISNSVIKNLINQTIEEIWGYARWPFSQKDGFATTNISGHKEHILLPEDYSKMLAVYDTTTGTRHLLQEIPWDVMIQTYKVNTFSSIEQGTPQVYSVYGSDADGSQHVRVHPVPYTNSTFEIWYECKPVLLNDPSDVPALPQEYFRLVLTGALYKACDRDPSRVQQSDAFQQRFKADLLSMKDDLLQTNYDVADTIQFGGW